MRFLLWSSTILHRWWFVMVMSILAIFCFIFWLKTLIYVIKNQEKDKIVWVLTLILLGIVGALIYYFVEKNNNP